ncbi:hypothetical protein MEZE111188_19000 [Mesobacillus zeae]
MGRNVSKRGITSCGNGLSCCKEKAKRVQNVGDVEAFAGVKGWAK